MVLLLPHVFIRGHAVEQLVSLAINPISIYSMVKYFDCTNPELEAFAQHMGKSLKSLSLSDIEAFYEAWNAVPEFETEEEELEYLENNKEFGNPIVLSLDLTSPHTIRKTQHLFRELAIRCEDLRGGSRSCRKKRKAKNKSKSKFKSQKKQNHLKKP